MQLNPVAGLLALAGAILMPVSLSLDWYTVNTGDSTFVLKGWDVFELVDALMVLVAGAVLLLFVARPPYLGRALMVLGAFIGGVIVVQLIDRPSLLYFAGDTSIEIGAWLGLLGSALLVAAGALSRAFGPRTAPDPGGAGSPLA